MWELALAAVLSGVVAQPPKVDLYGDPLPPGAVVRLGTVRSRMPIHSFGVRADGVVVTVGYGEAGRLDVAFWPPAAGRPICRFPDPRAGRAFGGWVAETVVFFPDGKRLVTGHADTTALVWELPPAAR